MKTAHDPLRTEQAGERTGSSGRIRVHRRDDVQLRIDLRNERAEVELPGKLARIEVADRRRLDLRRIDLRILDRLASRFRDEVADRLTFLLQVALKISSPAAENVNRFVHVVGV